MGVRDASTHEQNTPRTATPSRGTKHPGVPLMAIANDVIPVARPKARTYDPNTVNVNGVVLKTHGVRKAVIEKFSKVFFEKNVGSKESPKWDRAIASDDDAKAFIRVYVAFKSLKNLEGGALVLSTKLTASLYEKATLAILLGGLTGIPASKVEAAKIDFDSIIGKEVEATTKEGRNGIAILQKIEAPKVLVEDDEIPEAPQPANATPARKPAPQAHANDEEAHYTDDDFPDYE